MKRIWGVIILALAGLILTASDPLDLLPYAREIDTVALMRTMGVDASGDGVEVSISGGTVYGEETALLRTQDRTLSGALLSLQSSGGEGLFYGHVGQIILGQDLAARGCYPVLDYVLRDVEMRLDTNLYLVRDGRAEQALQMPEDRTPITDRLEAVESAAALRSDTMPRTVGEVMTDLEERGAAFLPALTVGRTAVTPSGYGILRDGTLVGWAEQEAAKGINLYMGQADADILNAGGAALRVVESRSRVRPLFEGDRFAGISVLCRVRANLAEAAPGIDPQDPEILSVLERALERQEMHRLTGALELSRELNTDFLGLRSAAGLAAPWKKAEIDRVWDLRNISMEVKVEGRIERSYDAL